jgi:hypothetical protein
MVLDRHVPVFDVAGFGEALAELAHTGQIGIGRHAADDEPDHRQRRPLLRPRRGRPSQRRAEGGDEIAPSHGSSLHACRDPTAWKQ